MAKRTNLAEALQTEAAQPPAAKSTDKSAKTAPAVTLPPSEEQLKPAVPPSRQGKKAVTGHFDPAVSHQLKQLALNNETTVQALLAEALNDLFEKHRMKPLA